MFLSCSRYGLPHGTAEYARQSAPVAYPCGYNAPSMFSSPGCYGQSCTPSYWYGAVPSVESAYTHGNHPDYRSYDTFPGHRADVATSRELSALQWDLPYGSYRQAVGGFPSLRDFTGGFEPSVGGSASAGQAVDLSWISGLGTCRSWDVPGNVYPSASSRYGFGSGVGTYGLASADGAKTDGGEIRQHLQNAAKIGYFATKAPAANAGVANSGPGYRENTPRDTSGTDHYERERALVSAPYENDKASDIIDEYHRQMMASYCRKECGDVDSNATASSFPSSPADSGHLTGTNPGQLACGDSYGATAYRSERETSGQAPPGTDAGSTADGGTARDGVASRCSSCCSGGVEQGQQMSQTPAQGVFSYDSEETETINCLSDFENLSSEDTRNAEDDGTESGTDE